MMQLIKIVMAMNILMKPQIENNDKMRTVQRNNGI